MHREFMPLKSRRLTGDGGVDQPVLAAPDQVRLDDPAISVMTDLTRIQPVSIGPQATVDDANRRMIERAVRLLFVLDGGDGTGPARLSSHLHHPPGPAGFA